MTQCIVYDNTTHESETFFGIAAAKKWMKERIRQGHEVEVTMFAGRNRQTVRQ